MIKSLKKGGFASKEPEMKFPWKKEPKLPNLESRSKKAEQKEGKKQLKGLAKDSKETPNSSFKLSKAVGEIADWIEELLSIFP